MNSKMTDKEKLSQVFGIHSSNEVDTFDAWTKEIAEKKAEAMGLVLTDKHWEVINFLRVLYQNVGAQMPPVHELSQTTSSTPRSVQKAAIPSERAGFRSALLIATSDCTPK